MYNVEVTVLDMKQTNRMAKSLSLITAIGHEVHEMVATEAMIAVKNMAGVAKAGLEGAKVPKAVSRRRKSLLPSRMAKATHAAMH